MVTRAIFSKSAIRSVGELNRALGKMVKQRRTELGIDRKELCRRCYNMSEEGLSSIENGHDHVSLFWLQVVFKVLKLDIIFQESDNGKKEND